VNFGDGATGSFCFPHPQSVTRDYWIDAIALALASSTHRVTISDYDEAKSTKDKDYDVLDSQDLSSVYTCSSQTSREKTERCTTNKNITPPFLCATKGQWRFEM